MTEPHSGPLTFATVGIGRRGCVGVGTRHGIELLISLHYVIASTAVFIGLFLGANQHAAVSVVVGVTVQVATRRPQTRAVVGV